MSKAIVHPTSPRLSYTRDPRLPLASPALTSLRLPHLAATRHRPRPSTALARPPRWGPSGLGRSGPSHPSASGGPNWPCDPGMAGSAGVAAPANPERAVGAGMAGRLQPHLRTLLQPYAQRPNPSARWDLQVWVTRSSQSTLSSNSFFKSSYTLPHCCHQVC